MKVVSNTSPLIGFAKIGRLDLPEQIFQRIMIPGMVYEEERHLIPSYREMEEELRLNQFYPPKY